MISPIESFFTFLSMNLAYALRGELVTPLNKRLMTHDQLNLEVAVGISWIIAIGSLLIKKGHQPSYGVVGLLFSFVDSSFKSFDQDRAYAINLIRSPFFSNGEWGFVCLKIQVGKKTYINNNFVPDKLLRIGHGTG